MKRLLVLAPSHPFPAQDGVKLRLSNVLNRLAGEWEISLLSFDDAAEGREAPLPPPLQGCSLHIPFPPRPTGWRAASLVQALRPEASLVWKFRSAVFRREVQQRAQEADAVLAVGLQMGQYLDSVPRHIPTALDNYNVESRILERLAETRSGFKRRYWQWEARKLARSERQILEASGTVFAISDADREGMAKLAPRARLTTLPMGIDLDYFGEPVPFECAPGPVFTFVGAFNWHVNEDAAVWLCEAVWPLVREQLPNAELHLVGREPSAVVQGLARDPSVKISGTVPDVRPAMQRSQAMLVPLRYGSGVRTKILEAFAAGRPVVSTSVGCEGLPVHDGQQLFIRNDAAGFASACVQLALEEALSAQIVAAGRRLVEQLDAAATEQLQHALALAFALTTVPEHSATVPGRTNSK